MTTEYDQLTEDELAAQKSRLDALRARYRTLPDMEARQRAIATEEIPKITKLSEPGEDDLGTRLLALLLDQGELEVRATDLGLQRSSRLGVAGLT